MNGVPSFTYDGYKEMLRLLKCKGYCSIAYGGESEGRSVILRHDVDFDPQRVLRLAQIEADEGLKSTYFFLLRSPFYNFLSNDVQEVVACVHELGHDIGLHYDETLYHDGQHIEHIVNEARIISFSSGLRVRSVSMHRPSKRALNENWDIPGIINSYSQEYFSQWEYVSDSRRCWRRPVLDLIKEGVPKLHILTHPFWYHEVERSLEADLNGFIGQAGRRLTAMLDSSFRDLEGVLGKEPVHDARLAVFQNRYHEISDDLVLRPLKMSDAGEMFEFTSKEASCQYLSWSPHRDVTDTSAWIASKLGNPCPSELLLGIVRSGKLIGTIRVYHVDEPIGSAEISYLLSPSFQHMGIMSEVVRYIVGLLFEAIGLNAVHASVDVDNEGSRRLLERTGFSLDPKSMHTIQIKGTPRSWISYLIRSDGRQ